MRQTVRIESLAYQGHGVAHLADGKAVFVADTVPGDRLLVEVADEHKCFARGTTVELLEASEQRVQAACPHAGACGGCPWQIVGYASQLFWKRRFVVDSLSRIAHIADADGLVAETIAAPKLWGMRNKVEFKLYREAAGGRLQAGMYTARSNSCAPVESCMALGGQPGKLPGRLAGLLNFVFVDGRAKTGSLATADLTPYRLGIRTSQRTGDCEVALWSRPAPLRRSFLAGTIGQQAKCVNSVVRVLTKEQDGRHKTVRTEVLAGRGFWSEAFGGHVLKVSAPSFFQVNTKMAELLAKRLKEQLLQGSGRCGLQVFDLYAGIGSFTLPLAAAGACVVAVEINGSSLCDLRRNLSAAGLQAEVVAGDVARELPWLLRRATGGQAARGGLAAIVDPPRSGLSSTVAKALADSPLSRLAYVSCDPASLARDARILIDGGFRLQQAVPFDFFPQTYHIETLALFEKDT
ncbi:MAG: 23S rRNA (uracil(1939)-C(5))-methyltransferase RlmD [Actinomycetia bacterium]|nr:23S rRNA (uracil(1939)-C(5))-methyltransferase RlmD [Actinomycetes bacterium]